MDRTDLLACTLVRQHVTDRAPKRTVVSDLCGLQAQFAQAPCDALRIRANDFTPDTWNDGLVKIWSHRGTMHVVRADELGLYLSARDIRGPWVETGWGTSPADSARWSAFIREQVASGIDGRDGLKQACRSAGMDDDLLTRIFHGWGGLLKEMCNRGLIAYRPGTEKRFMLPPPVTWMDRDEARTLLALRYFQHYGPATAGDCAAFLGYRVAEVRELIRRIRPQLTETFVNGTSYLYAGELDDAGTRVPACVLLAGFDQLVLGYRDRSRIIDDRDLKLVTNIAGIVFPIVLYRGRARARWKRTGSTVTITPFRELSPTAQRIIEARARRLFAGERIRVMFAPPLCR